MNGESRVPFQPRRLWIALGLLGLAGLLIIVGYRRQAHVRHVYDDQPHPTPWVWLDYVTLDKTGAKTGQFEGSLLVSRSKTLRLDNTLQAEVTLFLDGETVYQGTGSPQIALPDTARAEFTLFYHVPDSPSIRGHLAFMQDTLPGVQKTIPPWRFAETDRAGVARILAGIAALAGSVMLLTALKMSRRRWLALALVTILALAARLITLSQKFDHDPTLWTMETVWDNYAWLGRGWLSGIVAVGGNIYQQGMFVYLGFVQMILGPDLQTLYLFVTLLSCITPALLMLTGWALFDWPVGLLAGLMTALFAPLIHYQQTLQIVNPATLAVFVLLMSTAGLFRWRNSAFAVLCGLAIGLGTVLRSTLLVLLLLPLIALALQNISWRTRFTNGLLVIGITIACIMPVTIANFRAGTHVLTANLGDYQLFRSNNLSSTGMNTSNTQSEQLALLRGDSWTTALRRELERDPMHAVQLTIRRVALFWEPAEHSDSDMINYTLTGIDTSSALNALSGNQQINARLMMVLALIGIGMGILGVAPQKETLLIGCALGLYMASLAFFYVIGRVRAPVFSILLLLAAVGIVSLWRLRQYPRRTQISSAGVAAGALILTVGANALGGALPRSTVIDSGDLPATLVDVHATYDNTIELLGYAYYDSDFRANGYLTFELYWRALKRPARDYVVSFRLIDSATGTIQQTHNSVLGTQNPPLHPTGEWSPGDIYYERYVLTLPKGKAPDLRIFEIFAGLYDWDAERLLPVSEANAPVEDDHVRLTAVGLRASQPDTEPTGPFVLVWNRALALQSLDCRIQNGELLLSLDWVAIQRPAKNAQLFAHVWDGDTLIAQLDAAPVDDMPLDGWPPGTVFQSQEQIPVEASQVTIKLGLYDLFSMDRWPITESHDVTTADQTVELSCAILQH